MKFKNISKLLTIGILLNSLNLNSFAGILSSDTRYESFESNDISITDILEEQKVTPEIEGDTLVNVAGKGFKETNKYNFLHGNNLTDDNSFVTFTMNSGDKRAFRKLEDTPVKPSTTYTLFVEIKENTITGVSDNLHVLYPISNTADSVFTDLWGISVPDAKVGIHKRLVTTKDNFDGCTVGIRSYLRHLDGISGSITYRIWMVEGDHTDKDIPYFEGIKSVGELENNTLDIIYHEKNMLKWNKDEIFAGRDDFNSGRLKFSINQDMSITFNGTSTSDITDLYLFGDWALTEPVMKLKKGTYTISLGENIPYGYFRFYFLDGTDVILNAHNTSTTTLNEDRNITAVLIRCLNGMTFNNITVYPQLELSSERTEYAPYTEHIQTINLNEPLRGLSNGIKDRIIKKDGQWVIERNLTQVTFDGSNDEAWSRQVELDTTMVERYWISQINYGQSLGIKPNTSSQNDKLINYAAVDNSCLYVHNEVSRIDLRRLKTDNRWSDVSSLKQWLQTNPMTVVYPLETPIYEPLNIDLSFDLYLPSTHIKGKSTIPVNIKVVVDRALNRAVEATTLAQNISTIDNISQARYWNNLVKDSIRKDYLQNIVNSINNITDLGNIETNNISSNSDIYIKGKNTLSLSLDTNTIVFEDFDGTEDMELLKAVNLTVSSSLPYDIKSTLDTDISNSDKSIVLNPMILNIKSSDTNNYQTFTSTGDELLLLSNESSGTNKLHSLDVMLDGGLVSEADVYKTVIKLEVIQK